MHSTPTVTGTSPDRPPKFDKLSFLKYMKNIGRAYRKQATELVSMCRTFFQAHEQNDEAYARLSIALQLVDDALKSAAEVEKKVSKEVDERFEKAIESLSDYEKQYHFKETVTQTMAAAKAKDKSSLSAINTLKEKSGMKPNPDGWSEPTTVVDFHLFKSLPDDNPTVVQQVLSKSSNQAEILWNFARPPHIRDAYGGEFQSDPITNFVDTPKVCVLTDRPGRVYLESGENPRAFGNVWAPKDAIIFKGACLAFSFIARFDVHVDVCGKLEGETIVGASVQRTPNLGYRVDPHTTTPSPNTNPAKWEPLQDWREPIRRVLNSRDIDIHICTEQPKLTPSGHQDSASTSSRRSPGSSCTTKRAHSGVTVSSSLPPAQSPPPIATETSSNHGTSQSSSPSESTSLPADHRDTPALPSSVVPEPRVISQSQGTQVEAFTEEKPLVSRKPDIMMAASISLLSITVTSPPQATTPHSNRPSGGRAKSGKSDSAPGAKLLEGAPIVAPEPDAKPQVSRMVEVTLPAQPQGWRVWFQGRVWKR
ncbi:hypothetical protein BC827DRAFT_1234259 [Russula dissimulans]|nr:hypothetical protein BC827DRAFT_1234259 [Russula dissimulans]